MVLLDCVLFDFFMFDEDGLVVFEVDVGWGEIVEVFVVLVMIVMFDEGCDLGFEVFFEEVVF